MKCTYWIAQHLNDNECYNVRAKTKREAQAMVQEQDTPSDFGPVRKVTVEYRDSFDLMTECLREDGGYWEA